MNGYTFEDQSHLANAGTASKLFPRLPPDWISGESADPSRAIGVLEAVRGAAPAAASSEVAKMLLAGQANARDAWDGVHLAAGDLMLKLPGILGVHCVTSANALHYAFRMSGDAETRFYLLLQGVGWMGQFANYMSRDDKMRDLDLSKLERSSKSASGSDEVTSVLAQLGTDADEAARMAFGYATGPTGLDTDLQVVGQHAVPQGG